MIFYFTARSQIPRLSENKNLSLITRLTPGPEGSRKLIFKLFKLFKIFKI